MKKKTSKKSFTTKSEIKKMMTWKPALKGTLYNLHPKSGATPEYCQGLVMGVTSILMAFGLDFYYALDMIVEAMPDEIMEEGLPINWKYDILSRYDVTSRWK